MNSRVIAVLVVVAGFGLFFWLGQGPLGAFYTPAWTADRIPLLFAPIALVAALLIPRSALWSLGGYSLGVLSGEMIGSRVYEAAQARLQDQLTDPTYTQNWEPAHPGWWIAILVFLLMSAVGCWLGSRAAGAGRTSVPHRGGSLDSVLT